MLTASLAATGTRTPVSCVTGRDTHPYTIATSGLRRDVGCLMHKCDVLPHILTFYTQMPQQAAG